MCVGAGSERGFCMYYTLVISDLCNHNNNSERIVPTYCNGPFFVILSIEVFHAHSMRSVR
jgi:hypothetical protein